MARTDVIVLGAGIVGASAALHLVKRGLAVTLVERAVPGEGTSFGNAGIIEGNTFFPYPFPTDPAAILRIAFKRATEANYHFSVLPSLLPWLLAYYRAGRPDRMFEFAHGMRPLFAGALAEHEALISESGAGKYLRKNGWLKVYRNRASFEATRADLEAVAKAGIAFEPL
ncbi:MAG: FAD-binding oxidoreductase, partial [Pseudorhodoplanes sp.]|nr:FAD-binding oxidoreductase [Pseudorhodoplanes sp.]